MILTNIKKLANPFGIISGTLLLTSIAEGLVYGTKSNLTNWGWKITFVIYLLLKYIASKE